MRNSCRFACSLAGVLFVAWAGTAWSLPTIYSTHGDGTRLGTIDAANAAATDIGAAGYGQTWAAAFDNTTGELFTIVNGFSTPTLGTFNLTTGAVTTIGSGLGAVGSCIAIEVASNGTIYAAGFDQRLWTVNRTTGVATLVGTMGSEGNGIMDMGFDPTTGTLWGTDANQLYTINPANAATVLVSNMSGPSSPMGIAFADDGTMYVTDYTGSGQLYRVTNPSTGAVALVGNTGFGNPHGCDIRNSTSVSVEQATWGQVKSMYE